MKINIDTPQERLLAARKKSLTAFWWFFGFGIFFLPNVPFIGVVLLGFAIHFLVRKSRISRMIKRQEANAATAAAVQKQSEQEARQARMAAAEAEWQHFLDENELVRTIHTKVVGVTFRNKDGSSRQELLSYCIGGETVEFEYFTYQGAPAYAVYCGGDQIGNLSADLARTLYELPDTYTFVGEISEVTGGDDGLNYGCNLSIDLYRQK